MNNYDLIVIGAGPGGYEAALHAAKLGLKTALVERRDVGGTCLNRGCIPTKTLLHSAEIYHEAKEAGTFGVRAENVGFDLPAIFARKQAVVEKLRGGVEALLKSAKVEVLRGTGTVLGTGKVKVTNAEGETEYGCENILCATGSVPARPPIPGLELAMSSDELLDGAETLYKSLIIIGGGVIGAEIAGIYEAFGTKVTVVEALDTLLPALDSELGRSLAQLFKKRGIDVHVKAMVKEIGQTADGLAVTLEEKGTVCSLEAEAVLIATGRRANTDLFACDPPAMERGRILTDDAGRTDTEHLYAIGDIVAGYPQLAHTAEAMGVNAVCAICGEHLKRDLRLIPSGVYTAPEIGAVGMTEKEAAAAGVAAVTGKANTLSNARSLIAGGERGFVKITAEKETGRLLGAVLMCERATDLIQELAVAISAGQTARDLLRVIHGHPTFAEAVVPALEALEKKTG